MSPYTFSFSSSTPLHPSALSVFMFPTFILVTLPWGASDMPLPLKYYAQNVWQQNMSKEYSVQWIPQQPHCVYLTLY